MNKFKVPAIFDKKYIDALKKLNDNHENSQIIETYGCLPYDEIGSSRVGTQLPQIDYNTLKDYIAYSKQNGIDFNYIMNTTCHGTLSNTELNKILHKQIELLKKAGVDNITVGTPYLMEFLKTNYPEIKVIASINMCPSSVSQILQLKEMGVKRIVLDRNINRNYRLLKSIKNSCDMDFELLANSLCLPFCIMHQYHNNLNSHFSKDTEEGFVQCYPYAKCFSTYIDNPILMLCSGWIRPEDLKLYTNIGIDKFKIDGRGIPSDIILSVVEPYMDEKYEGNLFDLMFSGRNTRRSISAFLDNREADGFVEDLFDEGVDCRYCGGRNQKCKTLAKKVTFNEEKRKQFLQQQQSDLNNIFTK